MGKSHVWEGDSAKPVHQTRAILPCLVWLLLAYVCATLRNMFFEKEQILLAACATCILLAGTPLLGRWALLRVHGVWLRVPRRERLVVRLVEVGVIVVMVPIFLFAYLMTQELEKRLAQETLWRTYSMDGAEAYTAARYAAAEKLLVLSLNEAEKLGGPDHPAVATGLINLAAVYLTQLKYEQAEPLFKRSLAIREKSLGPDHPSVASSLNSLALLYDRQGKRDLAEPLYKRSLVMREKSLGPEHADVATSLNNLARLYDMQGKDSLAEPLFKRALAIFETGSDPEHPELATCLNHLRILYLRIRRSIRTVGVEKILSWGRKGAGSAP